MKLELRALPPVVTILVFAVMLGSGPLVSAAEPAGTIEIEKCRVKPLDRVVLAASRVGVLHFVVGREGTVVEKGAVAARLDDALARTALAVATKRAGNDVEIRYGRKAAEVAEAEHRKAREANEIARSAIPDVEIERLKLAEERSRLQVEQEEHNLEVAALEVERARAELESHTVVSPIDGIVTRILKSRGEAVRQGDPIVEVTATNRMLVEGHVDLEHAWKVRSGNTVRVRLDLPGVDLVIEEHVFNGRITFVDIAAEPVTRTVRVLAEVANEEALLKAGLTARMWIETGDAAAADASRDVEAAPGR